MKNPARILTGFVATLWMFMGMDVMGQGSLTPPGAPGETMHTLEEVYERTDPRTPISSLPYTISNALTITGCDPALVTKLLSCHYQWNRDHEVK